MLITILVGLEQQTRQTISLFPRVSQPGGGGRAAAGLSFSRAAAPPLYDLSGLCGSLQLSPVSPSSTPGPVRSDLSVCPFVNFRCLKVAVLCPLTPPAVCFFGLQELFKELGVCTFWSPSELVTWLTCSLLFNSCCPRQAFLHMWLL